jgi:hypothetical protein
MEAAAAIPSSPAQFAASCRSAPIVFDGVRTDLCSTLAQVILGKMQTSRGRVGSLNVGGWKSNEDFFQWPDPAVQDLRQTIVSMIGASAPVAWAMVNRAGSHHPRHQHRVAIVTGVYYVAAGDPITPTIVETGEGDLAIDPYPGRLLVFRGDTWHHVPVYPGDLPRITIAFDVRR